MKSKLVVATLVITLGLLMAYGANAQQSLSEYLGGMRPVASGPIALVNPTARCTDNFLGQTCPTGQTIYTEVDILDPNYSADTFAVTAATAQRIAQSWNTGDILKAYWHDEDEQTPFCSGYQYILYNSTQNNWACADNS
ncbi:MAG: hypothetical protein ACRETA_10060 [Gammaproteobacteria bacterium]